MRSDTEDSSQQQPVQQGHYDKTWNDWNAAEVSTYLLIILYTVDVFLFAFSGGNFFLFFFRQVEDSFLCVCCFIRNAEFHSCSRITA